MIIKLYIMVDIKLLVDVSNIISMVKKIVCFIFYEK